MSIEFGGMLIVMAFVCASAGGALVAAGMLWLHFMRKRDESKATATSELGAALAGTHFGDPTELW